jgi:hypothetical protein
MVDEKQQPEEGTGGAGPERVPGSDASAAQAAASEAATEPAAAGGAAPGGAAAGETEPSVTARQGAAASEEPVAAAPMREAADAVPPSILGPRAAHTLPPPPPRPRTPWGAMLTSGVIGGAMVAAAAGYGLYNYMPDDGSATNVLFARIGAVELVVNDLNARAAQPPAESQAAKELAARVAKLEAALASPAEPEAVKTIAARLAKIEAVLAGASPAAPASEPSAPGVTDPALAERLAAAKSLADELARLDRRADETVAAVREARERAEAAMRAVAEAAASRPPGVGKAEFDALATRVATLEKATTSLQEALARRPESSGADRAVRLALVAAGLRGAVDRGAPFAGELDAAKALVPDPQALAPLAPFAASGVPSAGALGRELAALAPDLARTAGSPAAEGGYLDRLQARAERLVRVRPATEAQGKDLSAVVSRIEAKAKQGDLAGALGELRALPETARALAEPWIKKAEAREAAVAAARRAEAAALAALANP